MDHSKWELKKTNLEENEGIYLQMKIHFNYIKCGFEVNRG